MINETTPSKKDKKVEEQEERKSESDDKSTHEGGDKSGSPAEDYDDVEEML